MSGKRGRTNKITLGMMKGKSITTSVPSIAVRFHSGDEELDIYPSADDEDEDELRSSASLASARTMSSSPPSNVAQSGPSRDHSPMKEYLRGLGKRSSSVDAGMMDVGSSGSDTWRIFHELKGKITKTVEEKLTEIKSERRSGTPLFSAKSSPRHGRLRAGGNSQDNSSISDSEDISESSNKDEAKTSQSSDATPTVQPRITQVGSVHFLADWEDDETPSQSNPIDETPIPDSEKKKKKGKKSGLRHRKGGEPIEMSSLLDVESDSTNEEMLEDDIESGVEVSEETKFVPDPSYYDGIPTVDFRTSPPKTYSPSHATIRRKKSLAPNATSQEYQQFCKDVLWTYRYVVTTIVVFFLVLTLPIPKFIIGISVGIIFSLWYHLIVGIRDWYIPEGETGIPHRKTSVPTIPDYTEMPVLEVPSQDDVQTIPQHGGWMNELTEEYDPDTYHINNTQSIYVRLDGSTLIISHPKSKIPKRALWNERKLKMKFIHQRIYDISGCSLTLLPEGMTRKRRWSKKYPICILLKKEAKRRETVVSPQSDDVDVDMDVDLDPDLDKPLADVSVILEESEDLLPDEDGEVAKSVDEEDVIDNYFLFGKPSYEDFDVKKSESTLSAVTADTSYSEMSLQSRMTSFPHTIRGDTDILEEVLETGDGTDEETFCIIDVPLQQETCLYLFSRTDRQKEDWYRRFVEAMKYLPPNIQDEVLDDEAEVATPKHRKYDRSHINEFVTRSALQSGDLDYIAFMNKFYHQHHKDRKLDKIVASLELDREVDCDVMWINAFVGRILFDVMLNPLMVVKIQEKIQKKLTSIKLPIFVEELLLTGIDLSRDAPMIHRASRPVLDDNGLWVDLDLTYEGNIVLTIETKINLMKLKKEVPVEETLEDPIPPLESEDTPEKCRSPIYDSSLEDSAESSPTETDEEHGLSSSDDGEMPRSPTTSSVLSNEPSSSPTPASQVSPSPSTLTQTYVPEKKKVPIVQGKGVMKVMTKFLSSQFFQNASELKYIKRAMEGVSRTQITLTVEIRGCSGQLAVNFPPPPSDRLWYGFRGNPRLWISVKPKFGQRQVNISYITNWLERKLLLEFEKKFVLPNMDDLVISPMTTDLPT